MSSVARNSPTCSLLAHVHRPGLERGAGRGAEGRHHALRPGLGEKLPVSHQVRQLLVAERHAGVSVWLLWPHLGKWSKETLTLVGNLSYCFLAVGG